MTDRIINCTLDADKFVFESEQPHDLTWLGFRAARQFYKHYGSISINSLLDLRKEGYTVIYSDSASPIRDRLLAEFQNILSARRFKTMTEEEIDHEWDTLDLFEKCPADPYQKRAILFALVVRKVGLYLEMGLGKTYVGSTLVQNLKDQGKVHRTLLVAPLSLHTDQNWPSEIEKFSDLSMVSLRDIDSFNEKADVYIINPDMLRSYCLTSTKRYLQGNMIEKMKFDCILFDESTKLKTHNSQTTQIFHKLAASVPYLFLMSGLPAPNNAFQLWGQMTALGNWLGDNYGPFTVRYGREVKVNAVVKKYIPKAGALEQIKARIEPVTISMTQAEYLPLPAYTTQVIPVMLNTEHAKIYNEIETDYFCVLDGRNSVSGEERRMWLEHEATVRIKLLQILNGFLLIPSDNGEIKTHRLLWNPKLDTIRSLLGNILADPKNSVIIWTRFREELSWLYNELSKQYTVAFGRGGMSDSAKQAQLDLWLNNSECQIMIAHPAAFMYGHTWNKAAYTIYTSATDDHEHYAQSRRRNYRRGQTKEVTEYRLVTQGTLEPKIWQAVEHKKRLDEFLKRR